MSEFKGTPGPWFFYTKPQPNGCPIIGEMGGLMVAQLSHSVDHYDQKDEAIANARLIAAAPELLEALINLERLSGVANMHDDPARVAARAAINKALGSEP